MWFVLTLVLVVAVTAFLGDLVGQVSKPLGSGRFFGYLFGVPVVAFFVGLIAVSFQHTEAGPFAATMWGIGTMVIGYSAALAFETACAVRRWRTR